MAGKKIQLEEKTPMQEALGTTYKGIMNGISHIIPVIITGGIFLAIVDIIGMEILGYNLRGSLEEVTANGLVEFLYTMRQVAFLALGLLSPVLAAFISQGIAGKAGLAPGFIGGMLAKGGAFGHIAVQDSGFLGALFAGILAGFTVQALKKLPFTKKYESLNILLVTPLIAGFIVAVPMIWFVGPSIATLNNGITAGLTWMADNNLTIPLGFIIGAMACTDFGGPINKIAYIFCVGLWSDGFYTYYAAFTAAKIIPGITVGILAMVAPKYFTQDEKDAAIPAIILSGLGGIGEQVIPFALRDPISIIPAQMLGGGIAGALILWSQIGINVGAGGSLITGLVTTNPALWFAYFGVGALVAFVLMFIIKVKRKAIV
ncbi:hypothetical protein AN644_01295 [Candidatus Epulonipiscium fishelsonii]|nr:hypothetical protein AN644_01295 [Epulopiscium sp. SCG-C06WGA-EpuloA1]